MYFWYLLSAQKLLPNKRLYNSDWFVISSVVTLTSPQSHLEAVCRQPIEEYELQQRNPAWQKEGLAINSLPARQGCFAPFTFAVWYPVCKKPSEMVPGEEHNDTRVTNQSFPLLLEPAFEHWRQTTRLSFDNLVVFKGEQKMEWLFKIHGCLWASGAWGGRCPAEGCIGSSRAAWLPRMCAWGGAVGQACSCATAEPILSNVCVLLCFLSFFCVQGAGQITFWRGTCTVCLEVWTEKAETCS